jgi:hypothetical protein
MINNEKKYHLTEVNPEVTQMLDLTDKDIQTITIVNKWSINMKILQNKTLISKIKIILDRTSGKLNIVEKNKNI